MLFLTNGYVFIKFTTANRYAGRLELGNLLSAGNFLKKVINLHKDLDLKFIQIGHTIGRRNIQRTFPSFVPTLALSDEKTKKFTASFFVFEGPT